MSLGNFVKSIQNIMRGDSGINGDAQRIEQMTWILFLKIYDAQEDNWEIEDDNYQSIIPENLRWKNWAVDNKDGKNLTGDNLLSFVNTELFPKLKKLPIKENTPIKKAIVQLVFQDANQYMKDGVLLRELINKIDEIKFDTSAEIHALGDIYETILKSLQSAGNAGEFYTPRPVTDFIIDRINPQLGEVIADFACGTGGFLTSGLKVLEKKIKTVADRNIFNQSVFGIEKKPLPYLLAITNMLLHGIDTPNIFHANSLERKITDYKENEKFSVIVMNPPYGGTETDTIIKLFPKDLQSSETADLFIAMMIYRLKIGGRAAVIVPDGFLFGTDGAKLALKKKLVTELNLHTIIRLPASVFAPYTSITTNILFFDKTKTTEKIWFYRVDIPEGYKHFSKTKPMKLEHFADCQEWWDNRRVINDDDTETFKAKDFSAAEIIERNFNLDLCGYPSQEIEILSPLETIHDFKESFNQLSINLNEQIEDISNLLKGENLSRNFINRISNVSFELANILKEFPRKMKASLLQAAIQGKLSEQLPTDGNAKDLLADIKIERAKLIKLKKIKADPPLPPVSPEEIPFDIPENWQWVRLGDICQIVGGGSPEKSNPKFWNGDINWATVSDMKFDFINETILKITEEGLKNSSTNIIKKGALIIATRVGLGKVCYNNIDTAINQDLKGIYLFKNTNRKYIFHYFKAISNYIIKNGTGTTVKGVKLEFIKNLLVPLPPLAEQKRIVARLDELLQEIEI